MIPYYALLTAGAFVASMTVLGAWMAHELRRRWEEYVL